MLIQFLTTGIFFDKASAESVEVVETKSVTFPWAVHLRLHSGGTHRMARESYELAVADRDITVAAINAV